jgi:hypothetical protein
MTLEQLLQELGLLIMDNEQAMELLAQVQGAIPVSQETPTEELSPNGLSYKDEYNTMCAKYDDIRNKYVSRFLNPPTEMENEEQEETEDNEDEQGGIDDLFEKEGDKE